MQVFWTRLPQDRERTHQTCRFDLDEYWNFGKSPVRASD
jgi:hypothetical protein